MKIRSILVLATLVFAIGCSKKEEQPAPATTPTPAPPAATQSAPAAKPSEDAEEPDAMGMTSGVAGAASGQAAAVTKSASEAAATQAPQNVLQTSAERLAHEYLKATKLGRTYPNDIVLVKTKKGYCDNCFFFTYRVGGKTEVTVQTADNVASIYGTMKELK